MAGGSYVGLDIGSSQIKVAELRKSGAGVEVVALGVGPTPPEAYENSLIVDAQLLGQAVKNLLKQSGIRTVDCISSVGGQSAVVVRVIEMPQMGAGELAEMMKDEVQRQVPFATNEVIMDYQTIDRPEGYAEGQNMDVLLAVAQQDMVDRHVEMLFAAGLKPKAIDVEPLAAGRTLLDLGPNLAQQPGYTVAIVNIGASNTDVGVFRDKLLTFPRTLPLGGDALTRAIADMLQVDNPTAEQYKCDVGEVILGQSSGAQQFGGAPEAGFGGFYDFGVPGGTDPVPQPEAAPSPFFQPGGVIFGGSAEASNIPPPAAEPSNSPSGRMPFDFMTPGAEEQPVASPTFGHPDFFTPAPTPVETPGQPAQSFQAAPDPFTAPAPASDLPIPASAAPSDPYRDQLRINVFNAMDPILAEISQELRRSLDYYRGRSQDAQINEILLIGGTARLKGIAPFLEQELGIPTRVADPLQNVQVTSRNYTREHLEEVASLFPISIGLGARELIFVPTAKKKKK